MNWFSALTGMFVVPGVWHRLSHSLLDRRQQSHACLPGPAGYGAGRIVLAQRQPQLIAVRTDQIQLADCPAERDPQVAGRM